MQFILENYLLIILVGLFFVFALIGYLIDLLRKGNNDNSNTIDNNIPKDIKQMELEKQSLNIVEEPISATDDLLINYDNNVQANQGVNENTNVNNSH